MKKSTLLTFSFLACFPLHLMAESHNPHLQYKESRDFKNLNLDPYYHQEEIPIYSKEEILPEDQRQKVISWNSQVPVTRLLNALKEGQTDQNAVLKLLSAPNVITRSLQNKEVWVYHWLWSYQNPQDPNLTMIDMSKAGKKVRKNQRPVSLVLTFGEKDILENASLRLIKYQKDQFNY